MNPQAVLARIPGWEDVALEPLRGGLTNRAWLVTCGERRAVLKIDPAVRERPFNTRVEEARIQGIVAQAGLAGESLYADERVLLTAFVPGEVWQNSSLESRDNLERLAVALRRLHELSPQGRVFDPVGAAKRYAHRAAGADPALVARCAQTVAKLYKPATLSCCHNDLVAANIVGGDELRFIDWEYACDNDPFFDLAIIVEHHELDAIRAAWLLDAYTDGGDWEQALDAQQRLYRALYWLWLAAQPGGDAETLAAAARRLDR